MSLESTQCKLASRSWIIITKCQTPVKRRLTVFRGASPSFFKHEKNVFTPLHPCCLYFKPSSVFVSRTVFSSFLFNFFYLSNCHKWYHVFIPFIFAGLDKMKEMVLHSAQLVSTGSCCVKVGMLALVLDVLQAMGYVMFKKRAGTFYQVYNTRHSRVF